MERFTGTIEAMAVQRQMKFGTSYKITINGRDVYAIVKDGQFNIGDVVDAVGKPDTYTAQDGSTKQTTRWSIYPSNGRNAPAPQQAPRPVVQSIAKSDDRQNVITTQWALNWANEFLYKLVDNAVQAKAAGIDGVMTQSDIRKLGDEKQRLATVIYYASVMIEKVNSGEIARPKPEFPVKEETPVEEASVEGKFNDEVPF